MADLAKSTHQVVSTGPPSPPALTPSPPRSDSSDSYVDLSFNMPDTDGTSLQDLIDSELAMRVSTETIDEDDRVEEEVAAATPVKRLDLIDLVVRTNGHASPTTDASARFIAAERGLVPSPPLKSPEELTEADILFYNTFNQAQSNGDESPSSPEIVTSEGSKEFDPFATIPPAELESPTFPPAELESPTFPPAELESPTFPPDTTSSPEEESPTFPPDTNPVVDSSPESPTNSSRVANRMDVCTNIPHIGVTPPDPGTEYDEDDYYSKLEARNDLVSQEVETTDLIGQEVETTDLIGQLVESTDLIGQEVESTDLIGQLVESTDLIGQEVESTDLIGQPVESSDIIVQEAESSDLISKEVEGSDLISQEIERSDVIRQLVESSHLIGQEAESSDLIYRQETESTDLISQEVERSDVIGQEVEVSDLISQEADSTDLIGQLLESSDVIGGDDLDVSLSESEPAEQKEDFDSWTKVSEVDFDRSEGSQVVDLSQASDIVEHVVDVCINSPGSDTESSEAITTSSSTDKKTTKKKKSETGDATTTKVKRNKKNKKEEKENISVKSSFSKFDAMSKKTVLHVRSGDASKAQKQFSQASSGEVSSNCKACDKQVFQMEAVKAERCVWHKNCFRCKECNKQLTVDMYSSHEGVLYCKPHFKDLFKPKAVIEDDTPMPRRRKAGPIISENQPAELPPEVVRASDKPDLGLEELSQLNVKSRFQAFEQKNEEENAIDRSPSAVNVKRSPSILSKLARFQAKGMDIGVTDDSLNGIPLGDASSSEEEEEDEEEGEGDREVVRANRKQRERPVSFSKMEDMKGRWESGTSHKREERREERKQEISTIRSRLFMGHQGKMKEAYQQAVTESAAAGAPREKKEGVEVGGTQARSIKERFERGEVTRDEDDIKKAVDEDLVDAGYSKKSRSLFLEMDASAGKTSPLSPARNESFKRPREGKSPEREIYRDPLIARADDKVEEQEVHRSQTASRMLSFFKHMEESATKEDLPAGPKPLKRFTPPPDCELNRESGSSDEESEEEEEDEEDEEEETNPNIIRASDKIEDEFLKQAQTEAVRAKSLRAKFERWEEREVERERAEEQTQEQGDQSSLDTTKSLRARFESMNSDLQLKDKVARPKVNRFVDIQTSCAEFCATCEKKVYHLEKVETGGKIFHKNCFRCLQCNCVLRMDTYTLNSGKLYCIPHFKQIFFAKGNYEEGFGIDQHKRKWASAKSNDILLTLSAQEH